MKIKYKLILGTIFFLVGFNVLFSLVQLSRMTEKLEHRLMEKIKQTEDTAREFLVQKLWDCDRKSIEIYLSALMNDNEIQRVSLKSYDEGYELHYGQTSEHGADHELVKNLELVYEKSPVGALELVFCTTRMKEEVGGLVSQLVMITLGLVLTIALGIYFFSSRLFSPFNKIIPALAALTRGDYSSRIAVGRKDEFGLLEQYFNQMAEALKGEIEARKAKEDELNEILMFFPLSVLVVDGDSRIRFKNSRFSEIFTHEMRDVEKLTDFWLRVYPNAAKAYEISGFWHQFADSDSADLLSFQTEHTLLNQNQIFVEYILKKVQNFYVVVMKDTTEMVRAQEKIMASRDAAEQVSRAKSLFLANMSHEIRTPMNGIFGLTELLSDTELNEEQQGYVKSLIRSEEHLLKIVNDILDISKIESGKIDMEPSDFSFHRMIEELGESYAVSAHYKKLELITYIASDVPVFLRGDEGKIRQILSNLIGNAVKFTEKGEVLIKAKKLHEENGRHQIRITVSDTGIGIPKAKQTEIFEEFIQGDLSYTKKYQGVGLGLSIARRLTQILGGFLELESLEGKGTDFHLTLTLDHPEKIGVYPENQEDIDFSKLDILVIDDNLLNRQIIEKMLKEKGMNVVTASSGQEGLAILQKNKEFDLLFLDVHMPGMDGFETAKAIQEKIKAPRMTTVMFTSVDIRDRIRVIHELGVKEYLIKPVKRQDLFSFIRRVALKENLEQHSELSKKLTQDLEKASHAMRFKILLVEDDPMNQETIVLFLEKKGYRVILSENGRDALEILERTPVDLVLMDIQMPVMNGIEATAAIRKNPALESLPVIALTAYAMRHERQKFLELGMTDYLMKPVRSADLFQMMEKYLERKTGRA